jgi:hypothetical protein
MMIQLDLNLDRNDRFIFLTSTLSEECEIFTNYFELFFFSLFFLSCCQNAVSNKQNSIILFFRAYKKNMFHVLESSISEI